MGRTIKHCLLHLLGREAAHSQTTEAERSALARHATGCRRMVEIGVYEGVTTAVLAGVMASDGVLHAVDPFIPGRLGVCWSKWIARREVTRANSHTGVRFVELLSHDAARSIDGEFDFVFIDGDHSLQGIQTDWADWAPRIQRDGIIALHDTRVPLHNDRVANLGSHLYFQSHIRHDTRFAIIHQVDSLSILVRH